MDKSSKNRYLIGISLIGILIIFYVYSKVNELPSCEESPSEKLVILIDQTDAITSLQQDELKKRIVSLLGNTGSSNKLLKSDGAHENNIPINTLVSIFYINSAYRDIKPEFVGCKIPSGAETNSLTADPQANQRSYLKKFLNPILLKAEITHTTQVSSPILETLNAISRTSYFSSLGTNKPKTKVIIFSDMIQNSDGLSLYGCSSNNKISETPLSKNVKNSYLNSDVYINLIYRDKQDSKNLPTDKCLFQYWQEHLNPKEVNRL